MSSLTRFGRRQTARLHSLTRRQVAGMVIVVALCAGVGVASATGHPGLALTLLSVLVAAVLLGVVHLARRLGAVHRSQQVATRDLRVVVEQLQRRVVSAVEKERLTAGDRHRELADAVVRAQRQTERGTDLLQRSQTREIEALFQLFQEFAPRAPMPSSGDFALNPTDLLELLHIIDQRRPRLVLELGSGTSSVWIAYALEKFGGQLVSIDHDREYAERTRALLAAHGLSGVAEVREAPLADLVVDDRTVKWYDVKAVNDLLGVELLLVDGPPESTGRDARYPALQVLEKKLASRATIICDDANRRDEQAALRRWTENIPGLTRDPEILGRHAVLSYVRTVPSMATVPS